LSARTFIPWAIDSPETTLRQSGTKGQGKKNPKNLGMARRKGRFSSLMEFEGPAKEG